MESMERNEEFQEEDVWAVLKGRTDFTSSKIGSSNSSSMNPRKQLPKSTNSMIAPRAKNSSTQDRKMFSQSAPVNIPDWSKIHGKNPKTASWLDVDDHEDHGDDCGSDRDYDDDDDEDDEDDEDEEDGDEDGKMVPPHEWVAKKLARSRTFSFSVCEGAGRTLKGRDLRRVRNNVLTKTGFLE